MVGNGATNGPRDGSKEIVVVRTATTSDWSGVATLLAELGRPDVRGEPNEAGARLLYESYLERSDTSAYVAEHDGEIVGFVNVEYRARLNYETEEGWIPELIVGKRQRGRGIGKKLLEAVEDDAQRRGCWGVSLESANWREDAHRFYVREGWTPSALAFSKLLDPSVTEPGKKPE